MSELAEITVTANGSASAMPDGIRMVIPPINQRPEK